MFLWSPRVRVHASVCARRSELRSMRGRKEHAEAMLFILENPLPNVNAGEK